MPVTPRQEPPAATVTPQPAAPATVTPQPAAPATVTPRPAAPAAPATTTPRTDAPAAMPSRPDRAGPRADPPEPSTGRTTPEAFRGAAVGPAPVDVHIGTIEIVAQPAATGPLAPPRSLDEHRSLRTYEWDG